MEKNKEVHKVVYGVTVKVDGVTKFLVIPAENRAQAIRKAAEGIIYARPMTPWEVMSWHDEQAKKAESLIKEQVEKIDTLGGLPNGDKE